MPCADRYPLPRWIDFTYLILSYGYAQYSVVTCPARCQSTFSSRLHSPTYLLLPRGYAHFLVIKLRNIALALEELTVLQHQGCTTIHPRDPHPLAAKSQPKPGALRNFLFFRTGFLIQLSLLEGRLKIYKSKTGIRIPDPRHLPDGGGVSGAPETPPPSGRCLGSGILIPVLLLYIFSLPSSRLSWIKNPVRKKRKFLRAPGLG